MLAGCLFDWNNLFNFRILLEFDQLKFKSTNQHFWARLTQITILNNKLSLFDNASTEILFYARQIMTIAFDKMDDFLNDIFDSSREKLLNRVKANLESLVNVHKRILKSNFSRTFNERSQFRFEVVLFN